MDIKAQLEPFERVIQRAIERKGSETLVFEMAGQALDHNMVATISDDRWLAAFTKQIFQSGFVWRVVENKWPDFERLFFEFNIEKMLMMPDEMWQQKGQDPAIIRNMNKIMTIKANAQMIYEVTAEHGSFGNFVSTWPQQDVIGLWQYLKKHGQRLGGNTGPYALRRLGVDTFLLSQDNESYFRQRGIIDGSATSKRSLAAIQDSFMTWRQQTGLDFCQLSRILSFSVGDNVVGIQN